MQALACAARGLRLLVLALHLNINNPWPLGAPPPRGPCLFLVIGGPQERAPASISSVGPLWGTPHFIGDFEGRVPQRNRLR